MDAISLIPYSMKVDGILRDGEIATFANGNQWFMFSFTRGRGGCIRL